MSEHPPAGWFPDPDDASQQRYWDGSAWTEHRVPAASHAGLGAQAGHASYGGRPGQVGPVTSGASIAAFVMAMFFTPALTALIGHAAWWPGHQDRTDSPEPERPEEPLLVDA